MDDDNVCYAVCSVTSVVCRWGRMRNVGHAFEIECCSSVVQYLVHEKYQVGEGKGTCRL